LTDLSPLYTTGSTYTWSNVTLPAGRLLIAAWLCRDTAPASATLSHPTLSSITERANVAQTHSGNGRGGRLQIWEATSAGATGTLQLQATSSVYWQGQVLGWRLEDAGDFIEATSAVTSGDTATSISASPPTSPSAVAGLAVGAAFTNGATNANCSMANWTTADAGRNGIYIPMRGAGFINTQPSSGPQFSISTSTMRPGVIAAIRFAALPPPPPAKTTARRAALMIS
ncbi:MAG: hypothetical protein NZ518_02140, partial [Dehalococcoidia bacterium]|nr:hypothetical protein [Dehalococcoidia bacterium]